MRVEEEAERERVRQAVERERVAQRRKRRQQHYQRAIPDRILNYMRGLSAEKARLFSADDVLLV